MRNDHCAMVVAKDVLPRNYERRPPPRGGGLRHCTSAGSDHLNASLTFSPACLMFALAWSALASASRRSSSDALPADSLTLPFASSAALLILSSRPIRSSLLSGEQQLRRYGRVPPVAS